MSGMINELIDILKEELDCYSYLIGLSEEKKEAIVNNNISELQKISELESMLINQYTSFERKRIHLMKDISDILASDTVLTLNELAERIKDRPFYNDLMFIISETKSKIESLKESNELNKSLIACSLELIDYTVNVISSSIGEESSVFDATGRNVNKGHTFFDARQ